MKFKLISVSLACCLVSTYSAPAATFKVDKTRSSIEVDAKATGHHFTGSLADYQVTASGNSATLTPSSLKLTWKFKDLKTADEKRDDAMMTWLGDAKASGSFTFVKTWKTDDGRNFATGTLLIHGVSKDISFPFTTVMDGKSLTVDGTASIKYTDFKLPVVRSMAVMTVKPELTIRFHLVGSVK